MRVLCIDIETYSSINLLKSGVYKYVSAPDFKILMLAYSWWGEDEVHLLDLTKQKIPKWLRRALVDPDVLKTAYNASFEITCLNRELGIEMDFAQWDCTMVRGGRSGYTMNLGATAKAMGIDEQKDAAGSRLIQFFSIPCKPTKKNGMRLRNFPEHDPEKWQQFCDYCKQDVRTEKAIREYVIKVPVTDFETKLWQLDQKINNTGIRLDKKLVLSAIKIYEKFVSDLKDEAQLLTGLDNPNSRNQLVAWLAENGEEVEDLKKATVKALVSKLAKDQTKVTERDKKTLKYLKKRSSENIMRDIAKGNTEAIMRMMEIRQQMSKTSVKKYYSMLEYLAEDGRVRNLLQFYGANRTGRFSGRGIQLQNLPQNHLKVQLDEGIDDLTLARTVAKSGNADLFEFMYGNVPDTLSQLIRTAFVAGKGKTLLIGDWSAIEAVILSWLAGEKWRMDVFTTHGKIYEASAAKMFKVPLESISFKDADGNTVKGKNYDLRAKGKVSELACIAKGQLVLTQFGLVPIENIKLKHKVWDGENFVSHNGIISRGFRNTIIYGSLRATPDHRVWIEGQPDPVRFDYAASCGARLVRTGYSGRPIRVGENNKSRKTLVKKLAKCSGLDRMRGLRFPAVDFFQQFNPRNFQRLSSVFSASSNTSLVKQKAFCGESSLRESEHSELRKLRRSWDKVQIQKCFRSRFVHVGQIRATESKIRNRSRGQQRALRKRQFTICYAASKPRQPENFYFTCLGTGQVALFPQRSLQIPKTRQNAGRNLQNSRACSIRKTKELERDSEKVETFDILNCGPNNRFTVSGVLVHNCGYQGAAGALITMGALSQGLAESELPEIIQTWRRENKKIVEFWYDLQRCAINCIMNPKKVYESKKGIKFFMKRRNMYIQLPSGRLLSYVGAKICTNRFGKPGVAYWGMDQRTKKWSKQETYGGKCAENVVQAIARDCLCVALVRLDEAGYKLVLHVHDEIICEHDLKDKTRSLKKMLAIMTAPIAWAPKLPLRAAGFESKYYKKD